MYRPGGLYAECHDLDGKPCVKASERYTKIFGRIDSLAEHVSWSTGTSNMLEWLLWSTRDVLGVSKTEFRKLVLRWANEEAVRGASLEEQARFVKARFEEEIRRTERGERYDEPGSGLATPREALRRAKYFSEDYLNKEFDIFWSLVSDRYLDTFYRQFTHINGGGEWFSHGNSVLFSTSTGIDAMQMDNLSYNPSEKLLVANELKLGGKKNADQMLKYALMFRALRKRNFIAPDSRFLLLFIGDQKGDACWGDLLAKEVEHCQLSDKATARDALDLENIAVAESAEYAASTWYDLIAFGDAFAATLDPVTQQVEQKLLRGFSETLAAKRFMRPPSAG